MSPSHSFEKRNGTSMTFIDYYQNNYEIRIKEERQPLLVSRVRDKKKTFSANEEKKKPLSQMFF